MKRSISLLTAVLMCIGIFAGCGNDPGAYVPTGDGLTWDEDYTGPVYTRPENEEGEGLTLTYYPEKSMNPLLATDFTNRALFSLLYQSLFTVGRDYHVEPQLCKNYRVSEDMKTYTFYIENATFSDGSKLTAKDVAATLQMAKESAVYGGRFFHVNEIALTEDGGVAFYLSTPFENLPLLLDIPIIKYDQLQLDHPLGTGPYILDRASSAILRRNTQWWCNAAMTVDMAAIGLVEAKTPSQIRDEFEFSDLGLVCADPGSDYYADYRCDYELWDCENGIFVYLACNMDSSIFSIPEIRSALAKAVDRDVLAAENYRGFARSTNLPASPLFPYYSQVLAAKYQYDGGEAMKAAVAGAQLPEGTTVTLLVNSDDSLRCRVARSVAEMLRECGLNVQMKEVDTEDYQYALRMREYDLYVGKTRLSANMDLSAFFYTDGALSYGKLNDVELYTLCKDALANHGNYYTLHQTVMNDGRLCPILFCSYAVYATRGLMTNLTPARDNIFYYSMGRTMESALLKN